VAVKYEKLKVRYRQKEDELKSAERRATTCEEDSASKDSQLEEMYAQMDSMQDIITSMEEDKKQTNEFLEDIRK